MFMLMFCLTLTFISLPAEAQNNTVIRLNGDNITLLEAIRSIESQSDYRFVYDNSVLLQQRVSVKTSGSDISKILTGLFENKGISYERTGNQVVLSNQ